MSECHNEVLNLIFEIVASFFSLNHTQCLHSFIVVLEQASIIVDLLHEELLENVSFQWCIQIAW